MIALVLASTITSVVVSPAPPVPDCKLPSATSAANHAPAHAQKLGELPDAEMDLAVIRSVDGCWVRQVVRFHVSDKTPAIAMQPGSPYTGMLVPSGPRIPPLKRVAP